MKTRTFRVSFSLAIGVALFAALSAAFPQAAQAQAQAADIAVLRAKMEHTDSAIMRVDERLVHMDDKFTKKFERIDATIVEIKETAARTDEKINGLQMQNNFVVIPLLLLTLAALFALLTKGTYWGVDRQPKAASGASRPAPIPPAQPHPS